MILISVPTKTADENKNQFQYCVKFFYNNQNSFSFIATSSSSLASLRLTLYLLCEISSENNKLLYLQSQYTRVKFLCTHENFVIFLRTMYVACECIHALCMMYITQKMRMTRQMIRKILNNLYPTSSELYMTCMYIMMTLKL